jgi:hypothetical protein
MEKHEGAQRRKCHHRLAFPFCLSGVKIIPPNMREGHPRRLHSLREPARLGSKRREGRPVRRSWATGGDAEAAVRCEGGSFPWGSCTCVRVG